ncbi:MAG: LuxR family transcriptional regulator [Leptolyngbya sp. ERB_1_1]
MSRSQPKEDWRDAPDSSVFYGRTEALKTLEAAIVQDQCRLLGILGIGGLGKTTLAVELAKRVRNEFDYVIWRSLRDAVPLEDLLADIMRVVSKDADPKGSQEEKISQLISYFQKSRCLLILDNFESIFREDEATSKDQGVDYQDKFKSYGTLLDRVGKLPHQSCIILTSRTEPTEIAIPEGVNSPIRSFLLKPMEPVEAFGILRQKELSGSDKDLAQVVDKYSGNPLALKLVSTFIQDLFNGNVSEFLTQLQDVAPFIRIEDLLDEQFDRLPKLERQIMYWLAINREPVTVRELFNDLVEKPKFSELLASLGMLKRRSLIEPVDGRFTLQNVVIEYITNRLIKTVSQEIETGEFDLLNEYALIKATAKDYIRNNQVQLILDPVSRNVVDLETHLIGVLKHKGENIQRKGYAIGNILNLLLHCCNFSLKNLDLSSPKGSQLTIWQAYLRGVNLQGVDFRRADLDKSRFTEAFGTVLCVASSPKRSVLALGDTKSKIRLSDFDGRPLMTLSGHHNWVRSVAFSPDGRTLVSGSDDKKVMLWNTSTGQRLKTLDGHESRVWSVAFSPDGQSVASSAEDGAIRLWNVQTGALIAQMKCPRWVRSIVFSPDGNVLASGGSDRTITLWDIQNGTAIRELPGDQGRIRCIAISPDGKLLASAGDNRTIAVWEISTGKQLHTLADHSGWVRSIAFSPNGTCLASGSEDHRVILWDVETGECLRRLEGDQGHTERVWALTFISSDGQMLVSSSDDRTIKFWDTRTGQCLKTFQGYTDWAWSIALSSDDRTLISGSEDQTVKIWDLQTGVIQKMLTGHTSRVRAIAISSDGKLVASGSDDHRIMLWNTQTGEQSQVLEDHTDRVLTLAFSPDDCQLMSGGDDKHLRLWDIQTGQCFKFPEGHRSWIWSAKFSPDGMTIASGSEDRTIRLWDSKTGRCLKVLEEHTGWVRSIAFSPDGTQLASGSEDQTVKLWDLATGTCQQTLKGKAGWIRSIAFSPDGTQLASVGEQPIVEIWNIENLDQPTLTTFKGHQERLWSVAFQSDGKTLVTSSEDGAIGLWNLQTKALHPIRSPKLYDGMKIAGATNLTIAQINTLKMLGATEDDE